MKYICKISSTTGRKNTVIDLNPNENRTRQLVDRGIIAEHRPEADNREQPTQRKRKTKGGAAPSDAGLTTEAKANANETD